MEEMRHSYEASTNMSETYSIDRKEGLAEAGDVLS
jgi:hypothetical protein